jgi:protein TonB
MKLIHMKSNEILQADLLDILFEDRNKEYGAYELRRAYGRRLRKALGAVGIIVVALFAVGFVAARGVKKTEQPAAKDVTLSDVKTPVEPPPPVPPPPPAPAPKVEMKAFTPPRIVKEVPDDQKPPEQSELEDVKIGTANVAGVKDDGIEAPVSDAGKGVVEAPKKEEDDAPFTKVEVESTFPGGLAARKRYLERTMHYPEEAVKNGIQGNVMVKFIVDKDGNVSDVEAISGPEQGGLREEAVRVIKKSGKWTPAIQNGRYVKSYKQQPVTFRLGDE